MARVDTIRAKQNLEMLDVWKDVSRQVVGRQREQVRAFPQSLKPKTQRDLGVELNVDKGIEALNRVLETKLAALEYAVQNFTEGATAGVGGLTDVRREQTVAQALASVINTGEVVALWNQLARYYQTPSLSRDSQMIIKTKLQELKPNLEALQYGLRAAVDFIFSRKSSLAAARPVAPPGGPGGPAGPGPGPGPPSEPAKARAHAREFDAAFADLPAPRPPPAAAEEEKGPKGLDPRAVAEYNARARGAYEDEAAHVAEPRAQYEKRQEALEAAVRELLGEESGDGRPSFRGGAGGRVDPRGRPAGKSPLALKILELLRSLSVYALVGSQVDGDPRQIAVADLDAAYKNVFQSLSQNEIDFLKEFAPRGDILGRSIRNIPDFDTPDTAIRLRALQEELGFRFPPDYYAHLRALPRDKLDAEVDKLRAEAPQRFSKEESDKLRSVRAAQAAADTAFRNLFNAEARAEWLRSHLEKMAEETYQDRLARSAELEDVPEVPEFNSARPDMHDYASGEEYSDALVEWEIERDYWYKLVQDAEFVQMSNELKRDEMDADSLEKWEQLSAGLLEELKVLEDRTIPELAAIADRLDDEHLEAFKVVRDSPAGAGDRARAFVLAALDSLAKRPIVDGVKAVLAEQPREGFGKPKGRAVDTRGLASMRLNYGADDSSSSGGDSGSESSSDEEDALDFDDTRNDHYYTKPHKR